MTHRPGPGIIQPTRNATPIKLAIKQFFIRLALGVLYALVRAKRAAGPVLRAVSSPFLSAGRFALRTVGVPAYRLAFWVKRSMSRLLLPAKNRMTFLVSNRYAIHLAVAAVAAVTTTANLQAASVRAESFGTQSMLYALVVADDQSQVEVVSSSAQVPTTHLSYIGDDGTIDPRAHIDSNYVGEDYVTTETGAPASATPAPPRTAVQDYVVEDGDTPYGIARKFNLTLSSVLWANDMTVRSVIRPGQTLKIPPVNGVLYTVKSGDNLSKIASSYGSDTDKIVAFNGLKDSASLKIGQTLVLPDGSPPDAPAPVVRRTAPVSQLFVPVSSAPAGKYTSSPGHALTGPTTTNTAKVAGFSGGSGNWVWPTDWHVITQYFGWKHTGVDIDGDYSTHSYAAADGVVIYAGWRNGYGYTVEIDHGNGLVTRYGHHSKIFVKVGQAVKAGELLAQTGTTGHSTGTHLHFEVIKNGKFQNPLDYVR